MIELRWVEWNAGVKVLQYRTRETKYDIEDNYTWVTEWSEWTDVPVINGHFLQ